MVLSSLYHNNYSQRQLHIGNNNYMLFLKAIHFLCLSLILTIFFKNSFASQLHIDEIFDRYQYIMDDWDGTDLQYKENANINLNLELDQLVESGISISLIQTAIEEKLTHTKKKAEYRTLLSSLEKQNLSSDEITAMTLKFMTENTGVSGSSFNGKGGGGTNFKKYALIGAALVAVVTVYLIIKCKKKKTKTPPDMPICYIFYLDGTCYRYF